MAIGADLWELGLVASLFTMVILFLNNRYKRFRKVYSSLVKTEETHR